MDGRAYLDLARENVAGGTEVHWRGAAGRAYYALMLECREALFRWGFALPPHTNVHTFVRLRFNYPSDPDLKRIGRMVDDLSQLRNRADYDLSALVMFASDNKAQRAIADAAHGIALLDAIDADPVRQAAALAAVRAAFP
jgi:hypothetical protein